MARLGKTLLRSFHGLFSWGKVASCWYSIMLASPEAVHVFRGDSLHRLWSDHRPCDQAHFPAPFSSQEGPAWQSLPFSHWVCLSSDHFPAWNTWGPAWVTLSAKKHTCHTRNSKGFTTSAWVTLAKNQTIPFHCTEASRKCILAGIRGR